MPTTRSTRTPWRSSRVISAGRSTRRSGGTGYRLSVERATASPRTADDGRCHETLRAKTAGAAMKLSVPGWWRRRSLRARLTITTTAGLAIALIAAAMLLHVALRASLITGLDAGARQGAEEVAALSDAHRLPPPVLVAPGNLTFQVLNAAGRIVDPWACADRLVPLLPPALAT